MGGMGGGPGWCITVAWVVVGVADILLYIKKVTNINIDTKTATQDNTRDWSNIIQESSSVSGDAVAHSLSSET